MAPATIAQAIERVLTAYDDLTALGEEIEDEWSYVNDLATAWRERLEAVADARPDVLLGDEVDAAIDRAIDEIERITDPHRAIDWLSTFPQVTLLALGEAP
jgi:ATP:corrinoid adenosyltransferase